MALTFCGNYIMSAENGKKIDTGRISKEEDEKIYEFNARLFRYLSSKVMSFERIEKIMREANSSPQAFIKARLVEPFGFYYNILANSFSSRLKYCTKDGEPQLYVPDLLAIYTILDFKHKTGYTFDKFDYIKNIDFEEMLKIYHKVHAKDKVEKQLTYRTHIQEQTVVKKMVEISIFMIDKLTTSSYNKSVKEVNTKIKSKKKDEAS